MPQYSLAATGDILDEIVVPGMQSAEYEHCLFQQDRMPPLYAVATREI